MDFFKTSAKTILRYSLVNVLFLLWVGSGCKGKVTSGLYVGNLSSIQNGRVHHNSVSIQLTLENPHSAEIQIKDIHKKLLEFGSISWNKWNSEISLSLSSLNLNSMTLPRVFFFKEKDFHWRCFQGTQNITVALCHSKESFYIRVTDISTQEQVYSLVGDLSAEQEPILLEEPKSYTLSEAIAITQQKNFDSQIEYQRLIQAQEAAKAAYFNLLPHFNFKSVFATATLNPVGMINMVADFVPFVIPVRWLKAKAAGEMREAERATINILKADLVNQISNLSYIYDQDRSDLRFLETLWQKICETINHIQKMNSIDSQTLDDFKFRLPVFANTIESDIIRLRNAVKTDRMAIALYLGLHNPNGVIDVDVEEEMDSIERAEPVNENDIAQASIERSLELSQLNHLIQTATLQKDEYYFNWADPDVPSSMSVSLSLIPYTSRAQSFIDELIKKREQTQSQILQKAQNAVISYNLSLEKYRTLRTGEMLVLDRIGSTFDHILKAHTPSEIPSGIPTLFWSLQNYLMYRTSIHATVAKFRISRSQIRRLLFDNHYSPNKDFRVIGIK